MSRKSHENLLDAIFSVWKDAPAQNFNITQLAARLHRNRRELKGALEILFELGLLQATTLRRTRKEYKFNSHFTYHSLSDRLYKVIPAHEAQDELQYSFAEWKNEMHPLVQKLLPAHRLRWYIDNLSDYTSTHAFARTIFSDGYLGENSPTLPKLEREYLARRLEDLILYGSYEFGMHSILQYFQAVLASKGDSKPSEDKNTLEDFFRRSREYSKRRL